MYAMCVKIHINVHQHIKRNLQCRIRETEKEKKDLWLRFVVEIPIADGVIAGTITGSLINTPAVLTEHTCAIFILSAMHDKTKYKFD